MAADMCLFCPHKTISAVPAPSLQDEVTVLRKELERERQKNIELEGICRDLNQDNDQYLDMTLQLERAVEKLLVALSLPTTALYRTGVTNYQALLNLIDDETPRLRTLIGGLNMLASLAVGLNSSIEMYKSQIQSLQEDVSRFKGKEAGIKCRDAVSYPLPQSSLESLSNKVCHTTNCADDINKTTASSMDQDWVLAADERWPVVVPAPSGQNLSKSAENFQPPKAQQEPDTKEISRQDKSRDAEPLNERERLHRNSSHKEPGVFNIFDSLTSPDRIPRREIKCAISVDGHRLAGDPFCHHTGWQVYFGSNIRLEHPIISLNFRLTTGRIGRSGKVEVVKAFGLRWELSYESSFDLNEVKAYKPASFRDLPLGLNELCADKHVRGTLWLVSLVGLFDSSPAYSQRILKDLDEDMKSNLKALFKPGSAKRVDIWFVNPKDDDRKKRKLDMDLLINLQSLH